MARVLLISEQTLKSNGVINNNVDGMYILPAIEYAQDAGLPVRFAASKVIEGDELILDKLKLDQNEKEMLEHIIQQMERFRLLTLLHNWVQTAFSHSWQL